MVVAMMNVSIEQGSAELFINTIKKLLFSGRGGLSLTYSKVSLFDLFAPFEQKLTDHPNCNLHLNTKIREVITDGKLCRGIITAEDKLVKSDCYVLALPPHTIAAICNEFAHYSNIFFGSSLLSVYLWLDKPLFSEKYLSLIGGDIEWIFNINKMRGFSVGSGV